LARRADVGIEDLQSVKITVDQRVKNKPYNYMDFFRNMTAEVRGELLIKALHKRYDEDSHECGVVEFNLNTEESAGTQKFVAISGRFLHTLQQGSILFVDELEARLHPLLTKSLVGLFNAAANRKNAQLIYATHEDGLLDSAHIRRDQVWFVEKDKFGASQLFSLAEYKVRKEAKFGKEYLLGLFGGVPRLRDFERTLTHAK
jgi:AAA15 family ATPase/GTPase